ncbi:hypothetical protein, partial [uncultured Alloprevotella sp.]|uniref:hypothetical protein n=1 Tax=uncultured Alloprevotella sp. TaxID=1283315 RepID=UPI00263723AB
KSLWNSFKDRFSDAQPNAKAPESECKSRTKSHYNQTYNKLFYAKTKIISEMAKFDMQKWQNKESLIERLPPALLFATSYAFSFFRLTRLFHLTQELLYGRPQKTTKSTIPNI